MYFYYNWKTYFRVVVLSNYFCYTISVLITILGHVLVSLKWVKQTYLSNSKYVYMYNYVLQQCTARVKQKQRHRVKYSFKMFCIVAPAGSIDGFSFFVFDPSDVPQ